MYSANQDSDSSLYSIDSIGDLLLQTQSAPQLFSTSSYNTHNIHNTHTTHKTYYNSYSQFNYRRRCFRAGCVLITPDFKILVVRNQASGYSGLPKGGQDQGESTVQCALRELREETSINLIESDLVLSIHKSRATFYVAFVPFDIRKDVRVDGIEIDHHEWIEVEELAQRPISRLTRELLPRIDSFVRYMRQGGDYRLYNTSRGRVSVL